MEDHASRADIKTSEVRSGRMFMKILPVRQPPDPVV